MKNIFAFLICFFSFIGFSQMTMKKLDGTPINNGDIITFNVTTDPGSYLGFKIYNSSDIDINVKVKCVSIVNSTGSNLQFCIDPICVNQLVAGNTYPPSFPSVVPANGENGNFDHLINNNTGINPNANVEYVMKFFQVDDANVEIGNSITFTYRYSPALNVSNFDNNIDVSLKSNIINDFANITVKEDVQMNVFDLNGRLVNNFSLISGENIISLSELNSGFYIFKFTNKENFSTTTKIIKN